MYNFICQYFNKAVISLSKNNIYYLQKLLLRYNFINTVFYTEYL